MQWRILLLVEADDIGAARAATLARDHLRAAGYAPASSVTIRDYLFRGQLRPGALEPRADVDGRPPAAARADA